MGKCVATLAPGVFWWGVSVYDLDLARVLDLSQTHPAASLRWNYSRTIFFCLMEIVERERARSCIPTFALRNDPNHPLIKEAISGRN